MTLPRWSILAVLSVMGAVPFLATGGCGNQLSADGAADGSAGHLGDTGANSDGTTSGNGSSSGGGTSADSGSDDAGTGSTGDDGATGLTGDGAPACVPVTACPAGVACGRYTDPCSGNVFACGTKCPTGQLCITTPGDPTSQTCLWQGGGAGVCGTKCGEIGFDACGVAINCGGCTGVMACVGNQCVPPGSPSDAGSASDACQPLTCSPNAQTNLCGMVNDGCGHVLNCSCKNGACVAGVCTAEPPECTVGDGGAKCGTAANACGSGTVTCNGTCAGDTKCMGGACTACTPPSCGAATCGNATANGCGPTVSCGTCSGTSELCYNDSCCTPGTCASVPADAGCNPVALGCGVQKSCSPCVSPEVCANNACCTPSTCAAAMDAGLVTGCQPIALGCGIQKSCAPCAGNEICQGDVCTACVPKTCANFSGGCGHSDGCGNTLNCCGAGASCQGGLCCGANQVNYNGGCCQPACDPSQPAGPQMSCGQVLYCTGGS